MHPDDRTRDRRRGRRTAATAAVAALATAGCAQDQEVSGMLEATPATGWLPSEAGVTDETGRIISLWNGSWIAALIVGLIVWGLIIWCVAAYRRRKDDTGLPAQVRYNVPLEIMYTVLPFFLIAVLFYYTARDQDALEERSPAADVHLQVIGKQWGWDFNYVDADVYDSTIQVDTETVTSQDDLPSLYLPVNQSVEIQLNTRDVNHSFWVPSFLYKKDLIAGRTNYYTVIPQREGVYTGKCAELCGEYHAEMLFKVEVVSQEEFDQQMEALRERGQEGQLELELSRQDRFDIAEDELGESGGRNP